MVSITLSVPEETRRNMKKFNEVNWSSVVRTAINNKVEKLLWKEQMLKELEKEKEHDKIALEMGDKIKRGMWERHKKAGW